MGSEMCIRDRLLLYSVPGLLACGLGLGSALACGVVRFWCVGVFASQCWRVLYVHPCIVVEKRKVNIIYLLLSA